MIKKNFALLICCVMFAGLGIFSFANEPQSCGRLSGAVGDWSGVLDLGGFKFTLVLHVQEDGEGALSATVDCVEQHIKDVPVDAITEKGSVVEFVIKNLGASYHGCLNPDESGISGKFLQMGTTLTLNFNRGTLAVAELKRPQDPTLPYPYIEEEVSYENPAAGVTLSGTLALPNTEGPFPTVLLIAGSGRNDRNETLLGHRPFLVLSDHLTRQGIAVLRVDKRGVGKSTGNYEAATTEDFMHDVLAGVSYLQTRKEIDAAKIGLVGHSEGGLIGPMAAAKSKDVAFIVMMAGPGVNGEEILYAQGAVILRSAGTPETDIEKYLKLQKQMIQVVKKESDPKIAEIQLQEVIKEYLASLEVTDLGPLENQATLMNGAWFRHFLVFDPAAALRQVTVPVLALNGALDLQVVPQQNLPVIAKALEDAGNNDFRIIKFPNLNHLFQTCQTGALAEYATIEETISPSVLNLISEWILEKTAQK